MKNIAVIPARSGSKGLKGKNIKKLNGKPLMAYAIEAAIASRQFDTVMVSTDSTEYADVAQKYGAEVPFLRSEALSGDEAGSWDVILETLKNYRDLGKEYDTVCLLQPTSPLRQAQDIINAYKIYEEKKADAVTSVCEAEHSPLWTMVLPEDGSLMGFRKNNVNVPRQKLDTFYRLNGAIYIRKIRYLNGKANLVYENEYSYIMTRHSSVDIDTLDDFEYAEYLMIKRKKNDEYRFCNY